jgi:spermidine synthase
MTEEGFYFVERFTEKLTRNIKVKNIFYEGKTKYQYVQIFDNKVLGRVLFLDQKIQSAEVDEFVYHESLVQPAILTHPLPQRVLIIGGGEGATLREVLRHDCVRQATMVDIDKKLVELCQEYLPGWSDGAFSDPRTSLRFGNAIKYVEACKKKFDVVISDLTEPIQEGPSVHLFTQEFFKRIFDILNEDGLFVLQAGSTDPYYHDFYSSCARTLQTVFPIVRPYWTFMFSFGSPWGFVLASKKEDPLEIDEQSLKSRIRTRRIKNLRFYYPGNHTGFFALPLYLIKSLKSGTILTDKEPFIWEL